MTRYDARRSALVAVLVGVLASLLVALAGGAPATSSSPSDPLLTSATTSTHAFVGAVGSVAHDVLRPVAPAAARATSTDRSAPAGATVLALALVLGSVGLVLAARRTFRRSSTRSWRSALAPRAPPVLLSC